MICMAIDESPSRQCRVKDIYDFLEKKFPYFVVCKDNWKQSVRYTLSTKNCFRKIPKEIGMMSNTDFGAHYWTVDRIIASFARLEPSWTRRAQNFNERCNMLMLFHQYILTGLLPFNHLSDANNYTQFNDQQNVTHVQIHKKMEPRQYQFQAVQPPYMQDPTLSDNPFQPVHFMY